MNNVFLHTHTPKKIVLEFEANVVFFNFKKWEIKKLFQCCTHFQTRGVESQKW